MLTIQASRIFSRVWALWGRDWVADPPSVRDFALLRTGLDRHRSAAENLIRWPTLRLTEGRFLRDIWNRGLVFDDQGNPIRDSYGVPIVGGQVYARRAEVYYPPTGLYYLSLRDSNTALPVVADELNAAWWAECGLAYEGEAWTAFTDYVVGDICQSPDDALFYQCIGAHTSIASMDYAQWAELVPFGRTLARQQAGRYDIGRLLRMWDRDPAADKRADRVGWINHPQGFQVEGTATQVWIEYVPSPPTFTGDAWSAPATYSRGDQVYFGTVHLADFYTAIGDTTAGQSPETNPELWWQDEIPDFMAEFLTLRILADLAETDRTAEPETVAMWRGQAMADLQAEAMDQNVLAPSRDILVHTR